MPTYQQVPAHFEDVRDPGSAPAHEVPTRRSANPLVLAAAAAVAVASAVVLLTALAPRTPAAQTVGDLGILASALLATVSCTRAARAGGPAARGWAMMAVAAAVYTLGHLVWTWYGLTRDHVYPFPSVADLGYVGYALPAAAGLLLFPRSTRRQFSGARIVLDALVVGGALLFISWATVLGPSFAAGGNGLARVTSLAYPMADILVASLVLTTGMRVAPGARRPWLLLGTGLLVLTVTDSTYVSLTVQGLTGTTGTPLVGGWICAWLLVAFAGATSRDRPTGHQRHFTVLQELLPVAPVLVAVVVAAVKRFDADNPVLIVTGALLLCALAAQQVVTALDKVRLANGLEDTVEARTAALRTAQDRFRSLVNSTDEAILSKTTDGVITSWNPAAERLYGYPEDEVIGRSVDLLVPPELREDEQALRERVLRGEQVRSHESERVRKDGTRVPVALTVSPIREDGEVVGLSVLGHDITEHRLHEAELTEAKARAQAASTAKSEFLATMSHEIRTPMNGVIGLTGLLLDTPLDDVQRRYATGVRGAGEALLGIIDDILDFSKLEAGKVELELAPFDPRQLVEEVGVLLGTTAAAKGLELVVFCEPDLPATLVGDAGRLRQVLINLASNAVKFTPSGEVVLRVGQRPRPPAQPSVVEFSVTDTGIGIDSADVERLFQPFAQADASTTRRFGGTGLGLAICRRLVVAMDGDLNVDSRVGEGSTFRFGIPLDSTEVLPPPSPVVPLGGLRVLVVDDNATNRLVLRDQLLAWGVRAEVAQDAAEGWALLQGAVAQGRPFDLALLDMCMPGGNGLDLASRISADPALSGVRTVILTSAGPVDRAELAASGVRASVDKPIRSSDLHDTLMLVTAGLEPAPDGEGAAPRARGDHGLGRVLVVEDNQVNQMVAEGILNALGYDVVLAENGLAALQSLSRQEFDAVLMDCHMPGMDGFEATTELRRREAGGRRTPVLAMTAGVLAEDRERCAAAGMDDFVPKPIDVSVLSGALTRWVTRTRVSPSGAGAARPNGVRQDVADEVVLDPQRIAVLRGIGPDDGWGVLPAVARAFVAAGAQERQALRSARRDRDVDALEVSLHRFRGAAANVGAAALALACQHAEDALREAGGLARADVLDGADGVDLLDRVQQASRRADVALTRLLDGHCP